MHGVLRSFEDKDKSTAEKIIQRKQSINKSVAPNSNIIANLRREMSTYCFYEKGTGGRHIGTFKEEGKEVLE